MTRLPPPTIAQILLDGGRGVPVSAVADSCARSGARVVAEGEDWRPTGMPCLRVAVADEAELNIGLTPPYAGYWEWADGAPGRVTDLCIDAVCQGGLAVSMVTVSAYGLQLAAIFSAALARRFGLGDSLAADMELALQEAVANALVHGNLEISSEPRGDVAGFAAYCGLIGDRLANPLLALRRVEICGQPVPGGVKVTVADEGPGFDLGSELAREFLCEDKSGRGLRIIKGLARHVEPLENGRRLEMVFG